LAGGCRGLLKELSMMAAVVTLGSVLTFEARCPRCRRPRREHAAAGACLRDVVIGRDVEREARMARLAALQRRGLKVKPFGIGGEE
jgi:hypothetical protein